MRESLRTPAGARWSCGQCGACCHHFVLGPVEPAIIAGLEARKVEEAWEPAAGGWYTTEVEDGKKAHYLKKREDGGCVFLQPDRRCAIHGLYGAEAKPGFCRQFPLHLVSDPKGMAAVVRSECAGYHHSHQDGEALSASIPRDSGVRIQRFFPRTVEILPGRTMPLESWMEAEEALLAQIERASGPPESLVAGIRGRLHARGALPEPNPARAELAAWALATALHRALAAQEEEDPGERLYTESLVGFLRKALLRVKGPIPPMKPDATRWLNLLLRDFLLGKRFAPYGNVAAGLGLFLLNTRLARLAAADGSAAAISEVLTPWSRMALNPSLLPLLEQARPALIDLYVHAT